MTPRALIVTADDFGMSKSVNEAVELAHRAGALTCASLVVTGEAAEDAVAVARRLPGLGVGLHLALVAAPPASDPEDIRDLLDPAGTGLGFSPERVGSRIALLRRVRDQVRQEIRAQLDLFRRTGLPLDHVDGHWHFHQHPFVVRTLADLSGEYGIRAVRVPYEPAVASWRAAGRRGLARRAGVALAHRPLAANMRRRLRARGVATNDWFFGMNDGGRIGEERLLGYVRNLPPGVTEIGLHPATARWAGPHAPPADWRVEDELSALVGGSLVRACQAAGHRLIRFGDLPAVKRRGVL